MVIVSVNMQTRTDTALLRMPDAELDALGEQYRRLCKGSYQLVRDGAVLPFSKFVVLQRVRKIVACAMAGRRTPCRP